MEVSPEGLERYFEVVLPHLNERQRRVVAGAMARMLGRGGVVRVAEASGMSRSTVSKAVGEVDAGIEPSEDVRAAGAGRKALIDTQPGLLSELDDLVEPETRGDPMSPLRWTSKSTAKLAAALVERGYRISADTVGRLLVAMGYGLQAPAKTLEGTQHPDRDGQFRHLNEQAKEHMAAGQPVVSVDTKKKELVGRKANGGREWQPSRRPEKVDVHDFPDPEMGKAIPYGVYDVAADEGWVSVGDDHDTPAFAVAAIRRWWQVLGRQRYPQATRLMVTADAGGSNGYRSRAWKAELGRLAAETGLEITVCHYPPGTSKWNRIEHRMFSFITKNWRGRPLVSYRTIVELIAATTTDSGLRILAEFDEGYYPVGVKVTDEELAALPLTGHEWHPEWNYVVHPRPRRE